MSWNYRLIDYGGHVAVHEVYYDKKGKLKAYSTNPISLTGDSVNDVLDDIGLVVADLRRLPPIKEADLPK